MVILDSDLEKLFGKSYLTNIQNMESKDERYGQIDQKRRTYFDTQIYPVSVENCVHIKERHDESMVFLNALQRSATAPPVSDFLLSENHINLGSKIIRTLVLMDATGSMSGALAKSKLCVSDMFKRAYQLLQQDHSENELQMQYACYRNYGSSAEMLLQCSPWETDPDESILGHNWR